MGITIKEIAAIAGCSPTTVSKVLNDRNMNISEATKKRIRAIAAEHNYVPNIMAKSLRGQRTNTLGFVLPDITNPFYAKITRGIEDAALGRGFRVVFSDTDNRPDRVRTAVNYLTSHMVDGIILDQIDLPDDMSFLPADIPIVMIDRLINGIVPPDLAIGRVYSDTLDAVHNITRMHILSGSRKIAFIASKPLSPYDRFYGFTAALNEAGIPLDERLLYWGRYEVGTGAAGIRHFLEQGLSFDSVVCGNDTIAVGAMDELKSSGLRIPEDVRVSGVGDIALVQYLTPPLTTIAQFSNDMGAAAADMLIDSIVDGKELYHRKIDYQIIRRGTL